MKQKPDQKNIILLLLLALLVAPLGNVMASQFLMVSNDCACSYATDDNLDIPVQHEQHSADKNCEHKQGCDSDCTDCMQCSSLTTLSMGNNTQQEWNRLQTSSVPNPLFKNLLLPRELRPPRLPV